MPGKAIQNEDVEHTAVVDNIGKFIAYNRGNKTSADLTPKIAEHLSRDKSFMGSIWLPEPEALKMHGDKYALTDEALEYARKILKGGTLIHNHPEPDSPLSSTDIMTALKLNLKRVEAICINGREYVLELERPLSPEEKETCYNFIEFAYRVADGPFDIDTSLCCRGVFMCMRLFHKIGLNYYYQGGD